VRKTVLSVPFLPLVTAENKAAGWCARRSAPPLLPCGGSTSDKLCKFRLDIYVLSDVLLMRLSPSFRPCKTLNVLLKSATTGKKERKERKREREMKGTKRWADGSAADR